MSTHTKQRKTFEALPGQYVNVTIEAHMIDPVETEEIISRIFEEASNVVLETKVIYRSRETAREEKASGKRHDVAATLDLDHTLTEVLAPETDPAPAEGQPESVPEVARVAKRGRPAKSTPAKSDR